MQISSRKMGKFAISVLMLLAAAHSSLAKPNHIHDESKILWTASKSNDVTITDCDELLPDEEYPQPEERPSICEKEDLEIPEWEWDRPVVKSFVELLDFYDPFTKRKERTGTSHMYNEYEDVLIDEFLTRFISTKVGTRLYFMLNGEWEHYDFGKQPKKRKKKLAQEMDLGPMEDYRTAEEKEEDQKDEAMNNIIRDTYINELIEYLTNAENPEVHEVDAWWNNIMAKCDYIKDQINKHTHNPEYLKIDKSGNPPELVGRQRRKFKKRLKKMWFGDPEYNLEKRRIGFRHVFVGEKGKHLASSIKGFHNWYQFYRLLCRKDNPLGQTGYYFDYKLMSRTRLTQRSMDNFWRHEEDLPQPYEAVRYCKISLSWEKFKNNRGSVLLFGSKPEYDFAIFTLCFHRRASKRKSDKINAMCHTHPGLAGEIQIGGRMMADEYDGYGHSHIVTAFFK